MQGYVYKPGPSLGTAKAKGRYSQLWQPPSSGGCQLHFHVIAVHNFKKKSNPIYSGINSTYAKSQQEAQLLL